MKRLLEFTTDFVLSGVLLGIIATSFFLTYNLNPVVVNQTSPVLGAVTQKPKPLVITSKLNTTKLDDHNLALEMKLGKLGKGETTFAMANVVNESSEVQNLVVTTNISKINLTNLKYELIVKGNAYQIYDDLGDKQVRDLKLEIKPGQIVDLELKVTAYSNIGYAVELAAQLNY